MKYAIISDIHGNHHALEAVIADATAQGVDKYLFLGDYAGKLAHANYVVEIIRNLESAIVIQGNGERDFINLLGRDPQTFTHEQLKPMYWSFQDLTAVNLAYLINLPETLTIKDGCFDIHLAHAMDLFFRKPEIKMFYSHYFHTFMEDPLNHDEYLVRGREALLACALPEIKALPKGIYLLGHNHLQFYMEYEGRIFINPGGCGQPLGWDPRAAYTILTINGSDWAVAERKVEYDLELAVSGLDSSGFTAYAPEWSAVLKLQLLTGKDYFQYFVDHVLATGREMGLPEVPVCNDVWAAAVGTWDAGEIYG